MESRFEELGNGITICVSKEHRFGTDAFLLAGFASPAKGDRVCDLGSGCGIIPLIWWKRREIAESWAVEIQEEAVKLMRMSVQKSGLEGLLHPVHADLKELKEEVPAGCLDVVTCNPPYKAGHRGILSESSSARAARHETLCTFADVCGAAARLLRYGGRFCVCQRPERLPDVIENMRASGMEPKRLRFVQQRPDKAPWLFLVEGRRGSRPFLRVEPPLYMQGGDGGFSREVLSLYGKGQEGVSQP